jgi:hypothetical protein
MDLSRSFFQDTSDGKRLRVNWVRSYFLEMHEARFAASHGVQRSSWPLPHLASMFDVPSRIDRLIPETMDKSERRKLLDALDEDGKMSLNYAVEDGNEQAARLLLERGSTPSYRTYVHAMTPDKETFLKLLIQYGNVDALDEMKAFRELGKFMRMTPLRIAECQGDWRVILFLLDGGASLKQSMALYITYATQAYAEPNVLQSFLDYKPSPAVVLQETMKTASSSHEHADKTSHVLLQYAPTFL